MGPSELDRAPVRGLPRRPPQGAAVKGGVYMNHLGASGKFFRPFSDDFLMLPPVW